MLKFIINNKFKIKNRNNNISDLTPIEDAFMS